MKKFAFIYIVLLTALSAYTQGNDINVGSVSENQEVLSESALTEGIDTIASIEISKDVFKNLKASANAEALKLTWSLDYKSFDQLKDKNLVIKYNTKIGAKRNKKGFEGSDWKFSKPFNLSLIHI